MSYVAVGNVFDRAKHMRAGGSTRRDWREGAAETPEKAKARQKTAEMEARRYGRPDLFTGDSPEMTARRAQAQAEKDAMDGGVGALGGGMSTYLMLGGAALVLLFVLKKRKRK